MSFLDENFLLGTPLARQLFHETAAPQGIIDYHCHLSPQDVAEDRQFTNLTEIWLEGDHYKWRALRAHGVAEKYITGDASPWEKFQAWAATTPHTLRNPLYIWTHLELRRYFGIETLLEEATAKEIWEEANTQLQAKELSARGILRKMKVETVCTTDDPADSLIWHEKLAEEWQETKVLPTFRPDKAFAIARPAAFRAWCEKLGVTANQDTDTFEGFLTALKKRHDAFHALGGRLSDHGLERCFVGECDAVQARMIFDKVWAGKIPESGEQELFGSHMMVFFARLDAEKNWTKQLHLGPLRNVNAKLLAQVGADAGCDTIGDFPQAQALAGYLGRLARENCLPRTILYNVNPADNYVFGTMAGNFQEGPGAGKIQYGSGWWFLDQEEGMRAQINALSNLGLLSHFVGMLTDSRSFLSYPRHEYFRRILCAMLGEDVATGRLPERMDYLQRLVRNVCHDNAARYFGF